jgi:heme/copper-type cytochrome/quinol oxidase subunit 4
MKLIQFVLSILLALCAIGMLYGAITTYSPIKLVSIIIMGIICIGSFAFARIAYTELHE